MINAVTFELAYGRGEPALSFSRLADAVKMARFLERRGEGPILWVPSAEGASIHRYMIGGIARTGLSTFA